MSLREELAAFASAMPTRMPAERLAIMQRATQSLTDSGIVERAAKVGDHVANFSLPGATGGVVSLADLLAKGPVVVTFYRGGWCPFCNMELRAYQRLLPEIIDLDASLIAISPQTPDNSLSSAEKNALTSPYSATSVARSRRAWASASNCQRICGTYTSHLATTCRA